MKININIPDWWVDSAFSNAEEAAEDYFDELSEGEVTEILEVIKGARKDPKVREMVADIVMHDIIRHMEEYFGDVVNDEFMPEKIYGLLGLNKY
jgi:hypothetical protein